MSKKYKLTDETVRHDGHILHRIVALKDFGDVHKGDKGGWVEKEENLSQEGACWVFDEAKVYGGAQVYDEAEVCSKALVYGEAKVYGKAIVYGEARVHGNAQVYGEARVCSKALVYDEAKVYDSAQVYGQAAVCGKAEVSGEAEVGDEAYVRDEAQVYNEALVYGDAKVGGEACVHGEALLRSGTTKSEDDYVVIGPQGSRHSCTTYHIPSDTVCTGCFAGTLKEFEAAVKKTHKNNPKYLLQYKWVIGVFKAYKQQTK